mmetsp:Transcript_26505/g.89182  ORF Transcript_26505/g.89182 Transcript_26505/m.89182 type:complete len:229 (-) Transcript_26505:1209-1895(-)
MVSEQASSVSRACATSCVTAEDRSIASYAATACACAASFFDKASVPVARRLMAPSPAVFTCRSWVAAEDSTASETMPSNASKTMASISSPVVTCRSWTAAGDDSIASETMPSSDSLTMASTSPAVSCARCSRAAKSSRTAQDEAAASPTAPARASSPPAVVSGASWIAIGGSIASLTTASASASSSSPVASCATFSIAAEETRDMGSLTRASTLFASSLSCAAAEYSA